MSFDLAVFSCRPELDSEAASELYGALCEGADPEARTELVPSPRVAAFMAELSARYPDLDTLPESELDDSPWSSGFDKSEYHAIFNIRWSAAEATSALLIELAHRHGLAVFDPQDEAIHHPPRPAWWKFWR